MKMLRFGALCAVLLSAGCASFAPPDSLTLTTEGTKQTVVLKTACGAGDLADCTNTTVFDCSSGKCERVAPDTPTADKKKEGGAS